MSDEMYRASGKIYTYEELAAETQVADERAITRIDAEWLEKASKSSLTPEQLYRRYSHLRQHHYKPPSGRP